MASGRKPDRKETGAASGQKTEILEMIGLLGKVVNSTTLYGPDHRMTAAARTEAYDRLNRVLAELPRVRISLIDDMLHVEGASTESGGALTQVVVRQMKKRDVNGFSLLRGMTREEFDGLMRALAARRSPKDVPFNQELERQGVRHVEYEEDGELKRIGADETVVSRREAERYAKGEYGGGKQDQSSVLTRDSEAFLRDMAARLGTAGGAERTQGEAKTESRPPAEKETEPGVEKILAFLKGGDSQTAVPSSEELQAMASDSERLANLIMESATVQQRSQQFAAGESLGDLVIGALRRTYSGLCGTMSDPQRQIDARKSLLMLEKSVLDRLHEMMDGVDEMEGQLDVADSDEVDEVRIATMTEEYVRRRQALVRMEDDVMDHLREETARPERMERLKTAFRQAGLPPDGWRELVAKSETGGVADQGGGGEAADLGALTMLLGQLDRLMEGAPPDPARAARNVKDAGSEVGQLSRATRGKVARLGERLAEAERTDSSQQGSEEGAEPGLVGRELLAEIVQELCQPATAISCSAVMLLEEVFGPLSDDQKDATRTLADCSEKLNELLEQLKIVVGYPSDFAAKHPQE